MSKLKTYGELYGSAMEITEQAEADKYFETLVEYQMEHGPKTTRLEAEYVVRHNLGYYAGYYSNETRQRVECLFSCSHPVFGSFAKNGEPTTEQALEAGKRLATKQSA